MALLKTKQTTRTQNNFSGDDEVVGIQTLYKTKNYKKFKIMKGNRDVNSLYVNQLVQLMKQNGNLTYERPVEVNHDGYVLDGQHRLAALRSLGWEVAYVIQDAGTIDTVRAINRGGHNWNWRDLAESYAKLGNKHYEWFLEFLDTYKLPFTSTLRITGGKQTRLSMTHGFQGGAFTIDEEGKKKAHKIAKIVVAITTVASLSNCEFIYAIIRASAAPGYDHKRMMEKLQARSGHLTDRATETDYLRQLEDIYNWNYSEENRTRLF